MTVIARPCPSRDDEDAQMVHAMTHGDVDALRQLYERHGRGILAYLTGQLGERALAEEVLQDVMLAAWHGASGFRGHARVRTWLMTIAHNRAVNARRRRVLPIAAVDPSQVDSRNHAPSAFERVDAALDQRRLLRALPPEQRAVVDLVFQHGMTIEDVAEVLGVAPGTVKSRLHRARAALRERLESADEHSV